MTLRQSVFNVRDGTVAKLPKRSVRFARRSAVYWLTWCRISRRPRLFQRMTLGAARERIPVAVDWEFMEFIALLDDHGGMVPERSPP
jgi:hypothetical protein